MKKGFTLIELLVVVLIIGILAAVALPQYNKAVEKSKSAQALTLLKAVAQAEEAYYMENGYYTNKLEELDIQIPWTGNQLFATGWLSKISNEEWSLQTNLKDERNPAVSENVIGIMRLTGDYKGAGFAYIMEHHITSRAPGLYCVERYSDGIVFEKTEGKYCKLFQEKKTSDLLNLRLYRMQ